jgi:hypothetical protein
VGWRSSWKQVYPDAPQASQGIWHNCFCCLNWQALGSRGIYYVVVSSPSLSFIWCEMTTSAERMFTNVCERRVQLEKQGFFSYSGWYSVAQTTFKTWIGAFNGWIFFELQNYFSPLCMKSKHARPGSTPKTSCTCVKLKPHNSRTFFTLLITYLTFLVVIPGRHRKSSSAAALIPAPTSGSSSAPTATAFVGSGSALLALRSLKISALAYGDEDHIIRRRGKVSVNRTILD